MRSIAHNAFTVAAFALTAASAFAQAAEPWQRHAVDDSSRGADGVRLADFNGDGRMDIATGWEEGGVVRMYLHPGKQRVKQPWPRVTVGEVRSAEDAVPVDLDGDSAIDIVSSCEGRTRTVYVHWAPKDKAKQLDSAAWKTEAIPASSGRHLWMFAVPLQIDGKHGIDLVVGTKGGEGGVGCFFTPENPRDLGGWRFELIHRMGWIMSLQAQDISGNGHADILISNRHGPNRGVHWIENIGSSADEAIEFKDWPLRRIDAGNREVMFLARGNVSGGARPDVLTAVKGRGLHLRSSPKDFRQTPWLAAEIDLPADIGTGKGVAIGDVDLDGAVDIVFSCENAHGQRSGVRWLSLDEKTNRWRDHEISGPQGVKFDRIELLDLDEDGDLDVLTCEERANLGVIWYENPTK